MLVVVFVIGWILNTYRKSIVKLGDNIKVNVLVGWILPVQIRTMEFNEVFLFEEALYKIQIQIWKGKYVRSGPDMTIFWIYLFTFPFFIIPCPKVVKCHNKRKINMNNNNIPLENEMKRHFSMGVELTQFLIFENNAFWFNAPLFVESALKNQTVLK